jgi:hypothetical protein
MAKMKTGVIWVGLYLLAQLIGGLVEATRRARRGAGGDRRSDGCLHHLRPREAPGAGGGGNGAPVMQATMKVAIKGTTSRR